MNTDHTRPPDDSRQNDTVPQAPDSPAPNITDAKPRALTVMTLLFFALLLAHIALNIQPHVLYQADEFLRPDQAIPIFPAYFQGMAFFKPFLSVPGGLAKYVGANIGQYFGIRYGGAAILTAIALIAFLITGALIDAIHLLQNQPNPFSPETRIRFELPQGGEVELGIYSPDGRLVRTLVTGQRAAGRHTVRWDGLDDAQRKVSGGVYFYNLAAPGIEESRRMILLP